MSARLFCGITCFLALIFSLSCQPIQSLGKNPQGEALKKIEALPNYRNGQFQNLDTSYTERSISLSNSRSPRWLRMLKYFINKPEETRPSKRLPSVYTDLKNKKFDKPAVVWFGHSSLLLKTSTVNILFDPNFSGYAGPFSFLINSFEGSNVYGVDDMPVIDALVISHDHYDHLDFQTVKKLRKKVKRVVVPIGVGSHFKRWGYHDSTIVELNWDENLQLNAQTKITAAPAHHRSNRTFGAVRKTLWASYVIQADGFKIYFSGDTGYSSHFRQIGKQFGPFDLAMIECGQYNKRWSQSHMHPAQSAKAASDLQASMMIPIHWAKFAESDHPWKEPVELLLPAADSLHVNVSIPQIGQAYTIGNVPLLTKWWAGY